MLSKQKMHQKYEFLTKLWMLQVGLFDGSKREAKASLDLDELLPSILVHRATLVKMMTMTMTMKTREGD